MRYSGYLPASLLALSLLTGCTTSQVKEASEYMAGSLLVIALDVATDGPERRLEERKRREAVPGYEWNPCLRSCEFAAEVARESRYEEVKQRKRRTESEEFRAEFEDFMRALEQAEEQSGDPPSIMLTNQ